MSADILFAGFGGQGLQFAAKVSTYAGMLSGKEVSLLPSYGPEVRGGTSNCAVRIDDSKIASPIVSDPNIAMLLNEPSFVKFISVINVGGTVVYDSSLIEAKCERDDIKVYGIPATHMAREKGLTGLANMMALGYMAKLTGFLPLEALKEGLAKAVPAKKLDLLPKNSEALEIGYNYEG